MAKDKQQRERSWFITFNNPIEHIPELKDKSPEEICKYFCTGWQKAHGEDAPVAVAYCRSANGLVHCHMVLEKALKVGFEQVKEFCHGAHIEATRGTKKQAEDYIHKRGCFQEKGEKILGFFQIGEIMGAQGRRNELTEIDDLLAQGKTPNEIFDICGLDSMRYEKIIKSAFYRLKCKEVGRAREVDVIWHLGDSGSGKSFTYQSDPRTDDQIYLVTGANLSTSGAFDNYYGQEVLYIDELKPGHIAFGKLLNLLDVYRVPLSCRYCDGYQLWKEVNITSVYTPQELYKKMIDDSEQSTDIIEQLNRIKKITFHFCTDDDNCYIDNPRAFEGHKNYHTFTMNYYEFVSREDLKKKALNSVGAHIKGDKPDGLDLFEFFA